MNRMDNIINDNCVYGWKTWALYGILAACMVLLPPLMVSSGLPSIGSSWETSSRVFEMFGFCSMAALAVVAYVEFQRRRSAGLIGIVSVVLFVLVFGHIAMLVSEYTYKSCDYDCYTNAADAILHGRDPYFGTGYLYPPVLAESIAGAYRVLVGSAHTFGVKTTDAQVWSYIFYLWQCAQFFLAIAAYLLSMRFVKALGGRGVLPMLLVAAVFVFNIPLIRALRWNQANLLMLVAILYVLAMGGKRPWFAGVMLALGACIKLYPVAILAPAAVTRRWRTLAAFAVALLAIIALDGSLGGRFDVWRWYYEFSQGFPNGFPLASVYRDNSLYGIITKSAWFFSVGPSFHNAYAVAMVLWRILAIVAIIYVAVRAVKREKSFAACVKSADACETAPAETIRFTGHCMDILALALVLSPLVWEHHYVLAVPIVLWSIMCRHRRKPWLVGIGSLLILLPPSFDVWLFSYHRIVGLAMLIASSSPIVDLVEHQKNIDDLQVLG
ncbi:MAG: glycosyltransferase family 87 protein [Armatimonadota bacterium]